MRVDQEVRVERDHRFLRNPVAYRRAVVRLDSARQTAIDRHPPNARPRRRHRRAEHRATFIDSRQTHGHAFRLLDEAMSFMMRHLPISGRFEPGRLERIDEPLYPVAARWGSGRQRALSPNVQEPRRRSAVP